MTCLPHTAPATHTKAGAVLAEEVTEEEMQDCTEPNAVVVQAGVVDSVD